MSIRRNLSQVRSEDRGLRFKRQMAFLWFVATVLLAAVSHAGCQRIEQGKEAGAQAADTNAENRAIKINSMISKYAKSIDAADTTLAAQIWDDSPEVSFIHPLGHEHGFEQIKHNLYEKLMGQTFSERKLSVHDVSVHVSKDAALGRVLLGLRSQIHSEACRPARTRCCGHLSRCSGRCPICA